MPIQRRYWLPFPGAVLARDGSGPDGFRDYRINDAITPMEHAIAQMRANLDLFLYYPDLAWLVPRSMRRDGKTIAELSASLSGAGPKFTAFASHH